MKKRFALIAVVLAVPLLQGDVDLKVSGNDVGYKIAFVSERDGNSEIYIMNSDGTGQTRLTNNKARDISPAFSPDGSKIAFISNRDGAHQVYIMNADGTGMTNLSKDDNIDYVPAFSPNGSKIVFSSRRDVDPSMAALLTDIYIMNADGTREKQLTSHKSFNYSPKFSPDSSKIMFSSSRDGGNDLYMMKVDGTGLTRLTTKGAQNASFSPDGSKIVFSSFRDNDQFFHAYVMFADGSKEERLKIDRGNGAVFSPDGSKFVLTSWRDPNWAICTMNLDGTDVTQLTDSTARNTSATVPHLQKKN